jgi:hypothetical protein
MTMREIGTFTMVFLRDDGCLRCIEADCDYLLREGKEYLESGEDRWIGLTTLYGATYHTRISEVTSFVKATPDQRVANCEIESAVDDEHRRATGEKEPWEP